MRIALCCRALGIKCHCWIQHGYTSTEQLIEATLRKRARHIAHVFLQDLRRLSGEMVDTKKLQATKLQTSTRDKQQRTKLLATAAGKELVGSSFLKERQKVGLTMGEGGNGAQRKKKHFKVQIKEQEGVWI